MDRITDFLDTFGFNKEKLTDILNKIDFTKLVPELDSMLGKLQLAATVAILIGPLILLVLGFIYLLIPPKEANHKAGFRTYFGMGSVDAWHFTQRLAGIVLGALGLVLTVVMLITYSDLLKITDIMQVTQIAGECLLWQIGLVAVAYFGISVTVFVMFDRKGNRRFGKKRN